MDMQQELHEEAIPEINRNIPSGKVVSPNDSTSGIDTVIDISSSTSSASSTNTEIFTTTRPVSTGSLKQTSTTTRKTTTRKTTTFTTDVSTATSSSTAVASTAPSYCPTAPVTEIPKCASNDVIIGASNGEESRENLSSTNGASAAGDILAQSDSDSEDEDESHDAHDEVDRAHVATAAASHAPTPVNLGIVCGKRKPRDTSYKFKGKGLFIIITNTNIGYTYKTIHEGKRIIANNKSNPRFNSPIEYSAIVSRIKKTFHLEESDDPSCVMETSLHADRCADKANEKKPFGTFINNISAKIKRIKRLRPNFQPSFLMFILLSPSVEHGQFLLESNTECTLCKIDTTDPVPRKQEHVLSYGCNGRRVSDLVGAIQQATDSNNQGLFGNIPKIFLIQTVSGATPDDVIEKGETKKILPPPDPDNYIPRGSDTFIFYAHTEQRVSWINQNGFYLITKLCDELDDLNSKVVTCNEMLRKFQELYGYAPSTPRPVEQDVVDAALLKSVNDSIKNELRVKIKLNPNSLLHSWLDNMCMTVVAKINRWLADKEKEETTGREMKPPNTKYGEMKPHISSTLRFKLSVTDMLSAQQKPWSP